MAVLFLISFLGQQRPGKQSSFRVGFSWVKRSELRPEPLSKGSSGSGGVSLKGGRGTESFCPSTVAPQGVSGKAVGEERYYWLLTATLPYLCKSNVFPSPVSSPDLDTVLRASHLEFT